MDHIAAPCTALHDLGAPIRRLFMSCREAKQWATASIFPFWYFLLRSQQPHVQQDDISPRLRELGQSGFIFPFYAIFVLLFLLLHSENGTIILRGLTIIIIIVIIVIIIFSN